MSSSTPPLLLHHIVYDVPGNALDLNFSTRPNLYFTPFSVERYNQQIML